MTGDGKGCELSIILPTYNERENVEIFVPELVEQFKSVPHEILVVDDSSNDGTGDAVQKLAERHSQVRLITREKKDGIGSALRHGYQEASGQIILSSDADLSFSTEALRRLYDAVAGGSDLALGSRHTRSSGYETPNLKILMKYIVSRTGNYVLKTLFRMPVSDFSANCRAMRREAWEKLETREDTNFFLFEMVLLAKRKGMRIAEVPVEFADRRYGVTKINHPIEIVKAFCKMIQFICRGETRG